MTEASGSMLFFSERAPSAGKLRQSQIWKIITGGGAVLTGPVDGDGGGVHADGHGSLLLLEKLPRVSGPLGDDGLGFLRTEVQKWMGS